MSGTNERQALYTLITVLTGIGFLLIVFLIAVMTFKSVNNPGETIAAVMGTVTGILGTLVGYVAGQSGKDKAEQRASKAEQRLTAVVGKGESDLLEQAINAYPEFFK